MCLTTRKGVGKHIFVVRTETKVKKLTSVSNFTIIQVYMCYLYILIFLKEIITDLMKHNFNLRLNFASKIEFMLRASLRAYECK